MFDRFTLAVVGGVLALVAAGLIAAALVRGRSAPPDLASPSGVVLAYVLAEQHGDAQTAWDLLSAATQAKADRERFLAHAGAGFDNAYLSTEDERIDGSSASVTLVRTYAGSGGLFDGGSRTVRNTVRLTSESAGWRITVPPDDYVLLNAKP